MSIKLIKRGFMVGAVALLLALCATPVFAQGGIKGRIIDDKKHPVSGVPVSIACTSVANIQPQGQTTDSDGRFQFGGLQFGKWTLIAQQGKLVARPKDAVLNVLPNIMTDVGDLMLKLDENATAGPVVKNVAAPKGLSPEEAAARNEQQREMQAKFKGANEDIAAGRFDDAITKLSGVAKDVAKDPKNSAACAAKLGEVYSKKADADTAEDQKKQDLASAEKSFKDAIGFDPATVDAYNGLATIYNGQGKFDDALKMSAKVTELTTAAGGAQDPTAAFNEGVMLWNASKFEEAEAAFKKTTELDPKKALAFYQLGLTQVNLGKLPEAIKSLEAFLALNPKGPEVDQAKAMLLAIKK